MRIKSVIIVAVMMVFNVAEVRAQELVGKVIATKNHVEAIRSDSRVPLIRRSNILNDDIVTTGDDARANFRLIDGTQFILGANSELEIGEYLFSSDRPPSAVFKLVKGVFRAITGEITKNTNPSFTVISPMGVIGIRGTDFWGGYLNPDELDVLLIDGEHSVVVENMFGKVTLIKPGTGVTIRPGQAPTQPKKWPKEKVQKAVETITF